MIAYPEKFFESAQAIATHSHLRWPDLSRKWIRRQQARIARVDWESRLPCVLGLRKSRLPLFTRKQQRLLDKAREMDGVPDLSALLKGKLELLSKKSTTVDPQGPSNSGGDSSSEGGGTSREGASRERVPIVVDEGVGAETSASGPKKKKKSTKTKGRATDEVPTKASPVDRDEGPAEGREGALVEAAPDGRPKKRTKRYVEVEPRPSTSDTNAADTTLVDAVGEDSDTPENLSEERRKTSSREGDFGDEPVANERSAPDSSARKSCRPEGSLAKKRRIEFPDRVEFSYDDTTPLILNPLRCAELTRQIRDLYFRDEYIDVAFARARSDGSMNFLVEKYNSALKQTMIQLGSSEKLAQARLKAIERVSVEHTKANEKATNKKEILRVKFEELEGKLKSARAAKKELAQENTRLEQAAATLEKEKADLLKERDTAEEKLIRERQRLKDSRGLEVTRERERVEAAMVEKANRCFGRICDHFTRLDAFGKAKNLYVPAKHIEVPEGGGLEERPENENLEEVPAKDNLETGDTPVREEESKNVGIEDPVLVSDSSFEGREDEKEEDDRAEETSPPQPVEEVPAAAATENPVSPPTLGTREEDDQDSVP
ncbi:hypothetical protein Bca52824_039948 [Brassica carinata]|uniref:Uncharacterized protein n=1 Tax=Brassica carinata TaxID=52824 RepID=A0A8X7UWG4_BRACI|nr:hypothetical protein Bca52824_039948 [Brassica carinata]